MSHDWHWTFGKRCHISFPGGGDPAVEPPHAFSTDEGCATMSGGGGQLLFYTDGQALYDANDVQVSTVPLGGAQSSAHSAIIVPPAGGGSIYHLFAMKDWASGAANAGPLSYTAVTVSGGAISMTNPVPLAFGPAKAAEKLAVIPHADCEKYWVISLDIDDATKTAQLYTILIDSDAPPSAAKRWSHAWPGTTNAAAAYCMKVSPDGRLLAMSSLTSVNVLDFDRATGAFAFNCDITDLTGIANEQAIYGVEFSPNSRYLYFSALNTGQVRRHEIAKGSTTFAATDLVGTSTDRIHPNYRVGALQLAPNGKIYGAKVFGDTLLEIADPDNTSPTAVAFSLQATLADGKDLKLPAQSVVLGLPTFTRIADDCRGDRCARLAAEVDEQIAGTPKVNALGPCDDRQPAAQPRCAPLELPRISPWTSIRWGDSECDCIEGDDTEVMHLTVCNPYRNLTLSGLTIHQLVVVQANGQPVPDLPDGNPSIELVPAGPYCFDDLAPCTCVTRQFVLRLRGAVPGPYRILVRGICFDACFHGDEEDCFTFDVCKD